MYMRNFVYILGASTMLACAAVLPSRVPVSIGIGLDKRNAGPRAAGNPTITRNAHSTPLPSLENTYANLKSAYCECNESQGGLAWIATASVVGLGAAPKPAPKKTGLVEIDIKQAKKFNPKVVPEGLRSEK
ncbi:hypothetical protein C8J56DRAFT_893731 [Mycena floridula]|nr:hypothetical protein C8J56DRAFT_893731 [Mycena floridula]